MLNPHTLAHYDDTKPIVMACDVSLFGVGAVLSQILADGLEHPTAYASCSLSPAERNYSHLFNESKSVPVMASARLQRWALTLSAYNYTIKYKSGKQQGNVDTLSRFPLPDSPASTPTPAETVAVIEHLLTIPLTASKIAK